MRTRPTAAVAIGLAAALLLAACGDDDSTSGATTTAAATTSAAATTAGATTTAAGATTTAAGGAALDTALKGVCPDTVTIQTDWNPEAEHGNLYQLVGPGYTIDTGKKTVTGPLVIGGKDTGVKVQVRAGGPATNFQAVSAVMKSDPSILLGFIATDDAVATSVEFPTKAIVAPFNLNPQIIMWDPATYPEVKAIKDLKAKNVKVRYFKNATYMDFLVQSGQLSKEQVDGSYDGTPANFVADGGKSAQQGFASAEPYFYEKELKQWAKPVAFQLLHDAGWTAYAQSLAADASKLSANSACFKKLVPIIQQAAVDYVKSPANTNKLILELVQKYNTGWVYTEGQAKAGVEAMLKYKLVANSPDGTLGSFDIARVTDFIGKASPLLKAAGSKVKDGLKAEDLVTNEFINKSIKL
jgi:hypothetical protein